MKQYKRDKRSPKAKNENVSKVMSANRAKNSNPEKVVRQALRLNELRGYRINYKKLPGTPDIAFTRKKVAIFVHGCYWHRCPYCNLQIPKNNTEFWINKFKKNIERDERKKLALQSQGWEVIILWECEIKRNLTNKIEDIKKTLTK